METCFVLTGTAESGLKSSDCPIKEYKVHNNHICASAFEELWIHSHPDANTDLVLGVYTQYLATGGEVATASR